MPLDLEHLAETALAELFEDDEGLRGLGGRHRHGNAAGLDGRQRHGNAVGLEGRQRHGNMVRHGGSCVLCVVRWVAGDARRLCRRSRQKSARKG